MTPATSDRLWRFRRPSSVYQGQGEWDMSNTFCWLYLVRLSCVAASILAVTFGAAPASAAAAESSTKAAPTAPVAAASGSGAGPVVPVAKDAAADLKPPAAVAPKAPSAEEQKLAILRGETQPYECAYVHPQGAAVEMDFCTPLPPKSANQPTPGAGAASGVTGGHVLTPENGDIVVVIRADRYFPALRAMDGQPLQLSLNGVPMGASARQTGWAQNESYVQLNFSVSQVDTQEARSFWSTAYQRVGFGGMTPLYVTLGWPGNPNFFRPDTGSRGLADTLFVTSKPRMYGAGVLGLAIVAGLLWAMWGSDIFRIGPKLDSGQRQAFSFARVQWGAWTTFAVASAIYLWIVYGFLPALSGSVLALAGVSTLAATSSFFMDANNPPVAAPSRNLWLDLLSGSGDATAQAHRFQALAVNVALLAAAVYHVCLHLDYPVFDSTWLAMLGISDGAQLLGKQTLEKQGGAADAQDLPLATVPAGPPAGMAAPRQQALPPAAVPAGPAAGAQPPAQP